MIKREPSQTSLTTVAVGLVVTGGQAAIVVGRVVLWPTRVVARAAGREALVRTRRGFESTADDLLTAPEIRRVIDRTVQQVLESDELDRALQQALSSPGVRAALADQGSGLVNEVGDRLRARLTTFDDRKERLVRGWFQQSRPAPIAAPIAMTIPFAGLATRTVAFAGDLVLAQVIFLMGTAFFALVASLVGTIHPAWLVATVAALGWTVAVGSYFSFFWTIVGQTPGMRLLHVRVTTAAGQPLSFARSLFRFVALLFSIAIFFLGILTILFSRNRRGLHDMLAGTVVVHDHVTGPSVPRPTLLTIDAESTSRPAR